MRRRPRPILVESCPKALQPLADEAALVVELFLGDLPRHVEADGAVLLQLHAHQLALRARDLAGHVVIRIAVQRRQPGHDQVRMFQHALDLAPDQGLEPLGADHRMLATAQRVRRLHPVALVVAPWRVEVVAVGLPAAPDGVTQTACSSTKPPGRYLADGVAHQRLLDWSAKSFHKRRYARATISGRPTVMALSVTTRSWRDSRSRPGYVMS